MKRILKGYTGILVLVGMIFAIIAFALWSERPVELRADDLPQAVVQESYPGAELTAEVERYRIDLTFSNHSDAYLTSGAGVDPDQNLFFDVGLDILLDGVWYTVPHEDYATAGVGIELRLGEEARGQALLSPYGKLSDGQYRLSFGYWLDDPEREGAQDEQPYYESYAWFDVEKGVYLPPKMS